MQKLFTMAAVMLALAAAAHAADSMTTPKPQGAMSGPQQPQSGAMSDGMQNRDTMAMNKDKGKNKKKSGAMKHDGMTGGSMSGPAQPSRDGMNH